MDADDLKFNLAGIWRAMTRYFRAYPPLIHASGITADCGTKNGTRTVSKDRRAQVGRPRIRIYW